MGVFLVYKTDTHHSYKSRDIIGVATTAPDAVRICQIKARKEGNKISVTDFYNLTDLKQTQNYKGDGEFQYEEIETDILL